MNNEISLADRRQHSRIELTELPLAAINGENDNLAVRAQVLDISLGGARVRIDRALDPARRTVEILIDGIKTVAEVVWRSPTELGLRYLEQAGDAAVVIFEQILTREFSRNIHATA
ncbi:PilZ domain-containing protein [Minwuia sp.]|uniref:PilZ domain-containing protein n=1 Tax=Minwuia sp. TaxID=2493630 RepID=UPI003A90A657